MFVDQGAINRRTEYVRLSVLHGGDSLLNGCHAEGLLRDHMYCGVIFYGDA